MFYGSNELNEFRRAIGLCCWQHQALLCISYSNCVIYVLSMSRYYGSNGADMRKVLFIMIFRDHAQDGFGQLGGVYGIVVEDRRFGTPPYIRIGESCCL